MGGQLFKGFLPLPPEVIEGNPSKSLPVRDFAKVDIRPVKKTPLERKTVPLKRKHAMEDVQMENVGTSPNKSISKSNVRFLVGDPVEVRMTEAGLRGSWHAAVVVEVHKGKRMVQYEELLTEDEQGKLKEFVPVGRASDGDKLMATLPLKAPIKKSRPVLRPRPPVHPNTGAIAWTAGNWVECYYDDAWWEGILVEDITTLNCEDTHKSLTRKSEVDVFFPEEDDVSKMTVNRMRVGQEWDEDTGIWSPRGCVPVPVVRPKKRSRKDSRASDSRNSQKQLGDEKVVPVPISCAEPQMSVVAAELKISAVAAETNASDAAESDLLKPSVPINTLINNILQVTEVGEVGESLPTSNSGRGYGYGERLSMFQQAGQGSNAAAVLGGQENGSPAKEAPTEKSQEEEGHSLSAMEMKVEDQSPVVKDVNKSAQDEEAARMILTHSGWKISKSSRKKAGQITWNCRSPKIAGVVKSFSSLAEALNFEAQRGPGGGNAGQAISPSEGSFADRREDAVKDESSAGAVGDIEGDTETGEVGVGTGEAEDEDDECPYAVSARQILKNSGWEVFNDLRKGSSGQRAWVYRTPPRAGTKKRNWFSSWRLAMDEHIKEEARDPKQKKRGGRAQKSPPVALNKRVSLRNLPKDEDNTPNGSQPSSVVKSEEVPNSVLPIVSPADERGYSDVDDGDQREVDIVVNSSRKRTGVDLGQRFAHSNSSTPVGNSYQEKPFGTIVNFTEKDKAYDVQVVVHGFLKEQVKVIVEKGDMVIKARYGVDEKLDQITVRCNGSLSARVALPKDVEYKLIAAELKTPLLLVTLPKSQADLDDTLEIQIQ